MTGGVPMAEIVIGTISDFFAKPMVAGVELSASLKTGDTIHVKGHTTDIMMIVQSMQIDNVNVTEAKAGEAVGIKLTGRVRKGDTVFVVTA
jgi:selenocysteine-specific translation elongation factor